MSSLNMSGVYDSVAYLYLFAILQQSLSWLNQTGWLALKSSVMWFCMMYNAKKQMRKGKLWVSSQSCKQAFLAIDDDSDYDDINQ